MAPFNAVTAAALHEKHPMPPDDLQLPPAPDLSAPATIEKSIRSFNPGSAAVPDKLSPQHLKELISRQNRESGALLLESLAALANVMLAGIVPAVIQTVLYGANLLAAQARWRYSSHCCGQCSSVFGGQVCGLSHGESDSLQTSPHSTWFWHTRRMRSCSPCYSALP